VRFDVILRRDRLARSVRVFPRELCLCPSDWLAPALRDRPACVGVGCIFPVIRRFVKALIQLVKRIPLFARSPLAHRQELFAVVPVPGVWCPEMLHGLGQYLGPLADAGRSEPLQCFWRQQTSCVREELMESAIANFRLAPMGRVQMASLGAHTPKSANELL